MNLRVLLIMDPLIPVPPRAYGGIERVVADVGAELLARGHEVTLWAGPGSQLESRVETFGKIGEWTRWSSFRNLTQLAWRFRRRRGRFDVIHNFGRLAYLLPVLRWNVPKVQTYMRTVRPANIARMHRMGARALHFTAVSKAIRDTGAPGGGPWSVIYNCAPTDQFEAVTRTDWREAPLVFLGRLERCKGAHTAIEVAQRTGRRLTIAGNLSTLPEEQEYFEREIEPRLDGRLVQYVGEVDNRAKQELLGGAACLLLPIEWREPFPVVLPEALLCGTPVIAFRRGGVPEGIDHGRTGFVCDTPDEMAECVGRLGEIDRATCRAEAERRFSPAAITAEYERLYRDLRSSAGGPPRDEEAGVPA